VPAKPEPFDNATYTSPVEPWLNVTTSSLPSPLKSVGEPPNSVLAPPPQFPLVW
jgi:hypothetical protein